MMRGEDSFAAESFNKRQHVRRNESQSNDESSKEIVDKQKLPLL